MGRGSILSHVSAVVALLATAHLGHLSTFPEHPTAFLAPSAGLATAVVWLWGPRMLPAVAVAAFGASVGRGEPVLFSLLGAGAELLECVVAVSLLRRTGFDRDLTRTRNVVSLVGVGMGLAPIAGATVQTLAVLLTGVAPVAQVWSVWLREWLAHGIGILLVAPLVLSWAPGAARARIRTHPAEWMGTLTALVVVDALVFGSLVGRYARFSLLFVTYPLLLWMGLRQPLRWTTVGIAATATLAVWGTLMGSSPFSTSDVSIRLLVLWGYLGTIPVMTLLLSAAVNEARHEAESHGRLAAVVDATIDFVGTATPAGAVLSLNPAGRALVGLEADAPVVGLPLLQFFPPRAQQVMLDEGIPTAIRQGVWSGETALLSSDGRAIPVSQVILAHAGDDGRPTYLSTILRDVSERQRNEEALREREANLRLIFDVAPIGIALVDDQGRATRWNEAFRGMLGYADADLRAQSLFDITLPEDVDRARAAMADLRDEGAERVQVEQRYRHADGSTVWTRTFASAVRDEAGRFLYTVSLVEDVTTRRRLEEDLLQAQKMESIGRLAGGVAHDFNNILTAILGFVELASMSPDNEAHVRGCLAPIRASAERASQLTRHLLAFARKQRIEPRRVDLRVVMASVEQLLRRLLAEDIDLVTDAEDGLWSVQADAGQFEQVILNLAVNGRDAMPRGGRLTIDARNVLVDEIARPDLDMPFGPYVRLTVSDEGTGMTEDVQKRVFDPFFTTKGPGAGTGLGLSMVHGTVKQHGGFIVIESEPGRGTRVSVYLPRAPETLSEIDETSSPGVAELARGDETVLLVEDEPLVREMAAASLRNAGYRVLSASSGDAALAAAAEHEGEIDLLLTDVVMPRMSGTELADRLLSRQPDLRVLFTSGYSEELLVTRGLDGTSAAFLQKPYSPATLARHVRQMLDS